MNRNSAVEWLKKVYHDLQSAQILYNANHYTDSIGVDLHYAKMYIKDVISRGLFEDNKEVVLAKFYRVYFHSYYRVIMKHKKDYYNILINILDDLKSYGFDINNELIQKQLSKKQKFEIYLLMNIPSLFKIYTEIKFYKYRKKLIN